LQAQGQDIAFRFPQVVVVPIPEGIGATADDSTGVEVNRVCKQRVIVSRRDFGPLEVFDDPAE
jgi:hypothetical protein